MRASFDFSSRAGKVVLRGGRDGRQSGLGVRAIALAGRVHVGAREMRALGVESAYSMVELVGESAAYADPAGSLAALAERVARTWSG